MELGFSGCRWVDFILLQGSMETGVMVNQFAVSGGGRRIWGIPGACTGRERLGFALFTAARKGVPGSN